MTKVRPKTVKIKNKDKPLPQPIGVVLKRFCKEIDSLADTLPLTMKFIIEGIKESNEKIDELFKTYGQKFNSKGVSGYKIDPIHFPKILDLNKKNTKWYLALELVPSSFLVSLVSQYDAFLGNLIEKLFEIKPDCLKASQKSLTYSELASFGSIENARKFIIEKEVENVLRQSHADQFDWFQSNFNIVLNPGPMIWTHFIELTERRNLFVHNNGFVSSQYLEICKKHKVPLENAIKLGEKLLVTPEYFATAFTCLFEVAVKLAQVLWRKVKPDQIEEADKVLNSICYELISENRYRLAIRILDFTNELKKFGCEEFKRMFVINRAQAYKWVGENEKAKEIIKSADWTACEDKFKLAEAVILDKFDVANSLVLKIKDSGSINKSDYREWPLFKEFRKNRKFQKNFENIFKEPLNLLPLPKNRKSKKAKDVKS